MADPHISVSDCLFLSLVYLAPLFTFSVSVLCSFTLTFSFLLVSPTYFLEHPAQSIVYTPSFIHVDNKLRLRDHAEIAVAKANKILGLIRRSYEHLDAVSLKSLYTSIVRPHLEYGHTVWPLNYKTDLTLVENVQHRATKLVPALKDLEYPDQIKQPSMAYRRCRGDIIEVYKYLHGQYNVDEISV